MPTEKICPEVSRNNGSSPMAAEPDSRADGNRALISEAVLASMSDAVYVRDLGRNLIYINPAAERLTGWSLDEALAVPCYQVFGDPGTRCNHACSIDKSIRERRSLQHQEGRLVRRDGTTVDVRVSISLLRYGDAVTGSVVVLQDLSDLREIEQTNLKNVMALETLREDLSVRVGELEAAQRDAAEAHARLDDGIESVSDGFALFDRNDRLVLCNETFRSLNPRTRELIKPGVRFEDLVRASVERGYTLFDDATAAEQIQRRLEHHRKPRGKIEISVGADRWMLVAERRTRDGGTTLVQTDITEAKRRERALIENETRLGAIIETAVDGIVTIDSEARIETFNPAAAAIFGYEAEEVMGENVRLLMPQPDRDAYDRYVANYLNTGIPRIVGTGREVVGLRKDGTTFPMDLAVNEMEVTGERKFTGIIRDITERKRIEQDLVAKTAILGLLSEITMAINEASDIDEVIQVSLDKICAHTGWPIGHAFVREGADTGRLVSAELWCLSDPDRFARFREMTRSAVFERGVGLPGRILETGKPAWITDITQDSNFPRAKMAQDIGAKSGFAVPVRAGLDVVAVLEFFTDTVVAPDQALLQALEQIGTQLGRVVERKETERAKNQFVSTVSHELRTPLTSIRGSLGLILGGAVGPLADQSRGMLDLALNNTERLIALVNDVLNMEKIRSGGMEFRFEPVQMTGLVERTINENQGYAETCQVTFVLTEADPEITVWGDGDRLAQVFANLLSNAAKFSPQGGTVSVSVTPRDGMIRAAVADHGPGIPEDFRGRIFEQFTQADSSDSRGKGGTGLGLSISKAIVEKHGGEIGFETAMGIGTTFYFDLPTWADPEVWEAVDSDRASDAEDDRPRILICEDDRDIAKLLSMMLREPGYDAEIAFTAAQAKAMARSGSYDAMTVDLILPDQDGLSMIRDLRAQEVTRDLPIVVVSVKADEASAGPATSLLGVADWLQKPIDQEKLLSAIGWAAGDERAGKARMLHVEDDADLMQVVKGLLADLVDIETAASLSEAQRRLSEQDFDLVMIDVGLPDGDGLDLMPSLRAAGDRTPPVIVFSGDEIGARVAAQVEAVLVKSRTSDRELIETIARLVPSRRGPRTKS